jgi:hypothetical protein
MSPLRDQDLSHLASETGFSDSFDPQAMNGRSAARGGKVTQAGADLWLVADPTVLAQDGVFRYSA